jgi:hypothetical protein
MRQVSENTRFDKRLIDRHMTEGLISAEDVEKRLRNIPDAESIAEWIDVGVLAGDEPAIETPAEGEARNQDAPNLEAV